jgi:hypothetical protein
MDQIWAIFPTVKLHINFVDKRVGPHFGQFFKQTQPATLPLYNQSKETLRTVEFG